MLLTNRSYSSLILSYLLLFAAYKLYKCSLCHMSATGSDQFIWHITQSLWHITQSFTSKQERDMPNYT